MELDLQQFGVIVVLATFISVGALFYGVMKLLNPERTARDRVVDLTGGRREADSLVNMGTTASVTSNIASLARPKDEDETDKIRRELVVAGFRGRGALEIYGVVRVLLLVVVPIVILIPVLQFLPDDLIRFKYWLYVGFFGTLGASIGYFGPTVFLSMRLSARKETLLRPFPDALDLLVSSVEAGLGLDAALRRVAAEMESAAPELARELQMVNHETAAGLPRLDALRRLDYRTGLAEVNSLVNTLVQAERFGTSVARALRIHSELVRKKRMLHAEEAAAKISPKLTVVMILFILPALFVVLAGPAGINLYRNLMPLLNGGR